jgi:hypothetical protein
MGVRRCYQISCSHHWSIGACLDERAGCRGPASESAWFRAVSNIPHAFAIQSFVAELAHAAGRDPKTISSN